MGHPPRGVRVLLLEDVTELGGGGGGGEDQDDK